jgi:hypothetical protein
MKRTLQNDRLVAVQTVRLSKRVLPTFVDETCMYKTEPTTNAAQHYNHQLHEGIVVNVENSRLNGTVTNAVDKEQCMKAEGGEVSRLSRRSYDARERGGRVVQESRVRTVDRCRFVAQVAR